MFSKRGDADDVLDLPRQASDDELLAWGSTLATEPRERRTPLRAATGKRRRPLVADPA